MFQDLFLVTNGGTLAATFILLILVLMLSMSIRLMLARRKRAYFSLTFSLFLIVVQYVLIIMLDNRAEAYTTGAEHYLIKALQTVAFITINLGIYQLYNPTKTKVRLLAYFGGLVAFAIMGIRYYVASRLLADPSFEAPLMPTVDFLNVWMDLYLYGLIFFCFYFVTPAIRQTIKYQLALVVYFITHSSQMLNAYVYEGAIYSLTFVEHFLPVLYFFIIFQILFDRVLELMQAVYHSSITDGLTGLFNRRYFTRQLQKFLLNNVPVSVIFCDIDNFKKLNDTQGHLRGDEVLRDVAAIVLEETEDIGLPGRYGGEEIVMIVHDPNASPAAVAEKVRARVEAEVGVTISVGWSKHRKGLSSEKLIKQADQAMYSSKQRGKNRVTEYKSRAELIKQSDM